jgi:NAD(P)-dependent dehydrogenase (short-subunit alcohol dehydrogenase family)
MKSSTISLFAASAATALACTFIPRKPRLVAGQVAVITGGSRGLGLALARRFGRAGLKLVLAARKADELEQARHQLLHAGDVANEDDILLVACDLTDPAQGAGLIDQTLRAFGHLNCLINNAGIIEVGPVEDQGLDAYDRAMRTNYFAALYTIHAALPHMLGRRSGAIVNIASIGGKMPVPHLAPYVASKFALVGFSETLHSEVRCKGVRVTTVCPGLMRTGGESHAVFSGQKTKEKKWFDLAAKTPLVAVSPEYAANRIFSAVQSGRAEITISPQAWLAARFHGLAPESNQAINSLVNHYLLPPPSEPAFDPAG